MTHSTQTSHRSDLVKATIAALVSAACIAAMSPLEHRLIGVSGGVGKIDFMFAAGATGIFRALTAYGDAGRHLYAQLNAIDCVFPFALSAFAYFCARAAGWRHWAVVVVPAGFLGLDLIENALIAAMLHSWPRFDGSLAVVCSVATSLKLLFLPLVYLLALGAMLKGIAARLKRRSRASP